MSFANTFENKKDSTYKNIADEYLNFNKKVNTNNGFDGLEDDSLDTDEWEDDLLDDDEWEEDEDDYDDLKNDEINHYSNQSTHNQQVIDYEYKNGKYEPKCNSIEKNYSGNFFPSSYNNFEPPQVFQPQHNFFSYPNFELPRETYIENPSWRYIENQGSYSSRNSVFPDSIYTPIHLKICVNFLKELVKNEGKHLTEEQLKKLFKILSVKGAALKQLYKSMFDCALENKFYNNTYLRYMDETGINWESILKVDNCFYGGNDIVSYYVFITGKNFVDSIEMIYDHLVTNKLTKNQYTFESKPLRDVIFPAIFYDILSFYNPEYSFTTWYGFWIKVDVWVQTKDGKCCLTFNLCKFKNGKLEWLQIDEVKPEKKILSLPVNTENKFQLSSLISSNSGNFNIPSPYINSLIFQGDEIWIYGMEKSFKSWFTRILAHTLSYGGTLFDKFKASQNLSVLYVDSEMKEHFFHKYCAMELKGLDYQDGIKFTPILVRSSNNPTGRIDILDPLWQEQLDKMISDYDIIIFDCYYSLTSNPIKPTEFINWMTPWKNKGKTFIIVDHTNREGELQGGHDKLRSADLCIKLSRQKDNNIEVSFPTARHLKDEDCYPILIKPVFENDDKFYFELCESKQPIHEANNEHKRKIIAYLLKEKHKLDVKTRYSTTSKSW